MTLNQTRRLGQPHWEHSLFLEVNSLASKTDDWLKQMKNWHQKIGKVLQECEATGWRAIHARNIDDYKTAKRRLKRVIYALKGLENGRVKVGHGGTQAILEGLRKGRF